MLTAALSCFKGAHPFSSSLGDLPSPLRPHSPTHRPLRSTLASLSSSLLSSRPEALHPLLPPPIPLPPHPCAWLEVAASAKRHDYGIAITDLPCHSRPAILAPLVHCPQNFYLELLDSTPRHPAQNTKHSFCCLREVPYRRFATIGTSMSRGRGTHYESHPRDRLSLRQII